MLLVSGRLLMLLVWGMLLFNLFLPFPRPVNIFMNVALVFTVIMHGLQLVLLKISQKTIGAPLHYRQQWGIFIFGVFELLSIQKAIQKNQRQK